MVGDILYICESLYSNSCQSLQTAAAVLKRSPKTSPHKTRRHTQPNSKQCSRNILHQRQIVLKLLPDPSNSCCCCIPIRPHSRHIPHWRQIGLKLLPDPSNSCCCCMPISSHSRHIPHQRQIVLKLLPDPSNSCCCCIPLSSHSRNIPHWRQIGLNSCQRLQSAAAVTSH